MSDIVIKVENLWKEYRLGTINHHTLTRDLQSWWAKVRGKEDPNSQLDSRLSHVISHHLQPDDRFWALQNVSFDVKQGDLVGIIGRNGAGKSTLLKILSQVTSPTKGEVRFKGRIASLLEVGTGFHPELTGKENIFLNGAILGMSKADIRNKLDEIVAFAEVEKFIDTPVKRYSSGMYVRLAFAVAAHLEPEILVVDEVLAVGDAQFQKKCLGKMESVGKEGRTIIFVSHNLGAICQLCKTGIHLQNGKLLDLGDIKVVMESYNTLMTSSTEYVLSKYIQKAKATIVVATVKKVNKANDKYIFLIEFDAKELIRDIHVGIGINDKFGTRLATLFSKFYDFKFIATQGINRICCEVENLPLKTGTYNISIHLGNGFEAFDYIQDAFQMKVETDNFFPSNKIPDDSQGSLLVSQAWNGEKAMEIING